MKLHKLSSRSFDLCQQLFKWRLIVKWAFAKAFSNKFEHEPNTKKLRDHSCSTHLHCYFWQAWNIYIFKGKISTPQIYCRSDSSMLKFMGPTTTVHPFILFGLWVASYTETSSNQRAHSACRLRSFSFGLKPMKPFNCFPMDP